MIIKGKVWKFGNNISTDLMMPSFAVKQNPNITPLEASKYVMYSNRPGWVRLVNDGDLIVGGKNFGCGSSRVASEPLKALGIKGIIAESFARIFFRNSISTGLPVMNAEGTSEFCEEGDILQINFLTGEIVNEESKQTMKGDPLPKHSPPMEILNAGGIIEFLKKEYYTV